MLSLLTFQFPRGLTPRSEADVPQQIYTDFQFPRGLTYIAINLWRETADLHLSIP